MNGKNLSSVPNNTERRMTKPQPGKSTPSNEEPAVSSRVAAALAQNADPAKQRSSFEAAMKLFHARQLREARELFVIAAGGPERDVAQRARVHIAMCDRRLEQSTVNLHTAEDHYNYGVALINTRNVAEARTHLEKALESRRTPTTSITRWRWRRRSAATRDALREPEARHRTGAAQPPRSRARMRISLLWPTSRRSTRCSILKRRAGRSAHAAA